MSSNQERWDLLRSLTFLATKGGILTQNGLQERKSDEVMDERTMRLVHEQAPGSFAQHTHRFIFDDDVKDSDTV